MVGPPSDDERNRTVRRLKVAFVLLVGASAGLITTQGDASLQFVAVAVGTGLALGVGLVWFLFPEGGLLSTSEHRRRRFGK